MPLSRLRLRLAGSFALAFVIALALLAVGALGYLWKESSRRFDARLAAVADGVASGIARELDDTPDSSLAYAANEVVKEWPANDDAFGIADERGLLVAGVNRAKALDPVMGAWGRAHNVARLSVHIGEQDFRVVAIPAATIRKGSRQWHFAVVAYGSTEGIESDTELLAEALAVAAPLIVLLSLAGGYLLSRRALRPVAELTVSVASIAPTELSRRLPVAEPPDEIGALAGEFNALLARLDDAQRRNRSFVREAAHQIRTPLTLVMGEAGHALDTGEPGSAGATATLKRIRMAAEQMKRRVDELFLLAEAQSGERVTLDADVELDGLVLECTDLMRERASSLGRSLAIARAEHLVVRGNEPLLKEALLEMIENACRHGTADAPISVSTFAQGGQAMVEVTSAGPSFVLPARDAAAKPEGLGVAIVQWIASAHGGELGLARRGNLNALALAIPVLTPGVPAPEPRTEESR